nr:phage tail sheath subtilisin-like domain-containing protein [Massilia sp. IC2-278]
MAAALAAPLRPGGLLEDLDEIDLVCAPDLMMLAQGDASAAVIEVQGVVLEHCRRMGNRFAILDALPGEGAAAAAAGSAATERAATERRVETALRQWDALAAEAGALYFPWVCVETARRALDATAHPEHGAATVSVPPCGHVAGVYARTDERAGPHQAPANELLHGVVRLDPDIDDEQFAALNDKGVNCLRSVPGRGIRVYGARTLSGQPFWRYVNVRRLFLSLARWVEHGCADLVFDTNDARLWERIEQRLRSYCQALYDAGALAGRTPAEAFHVKCDAETNLREVAAAGMVVAEVGLAPLAPAEFIVVRITQHAGGAAVGIPVDGRALSRADIRAGIRAVI